ncbi:MAG: U32 family peptidase [Coriobacteriia bacterium]|nr:U32 family peptidase [Coriobacteriia bacterium]
MRFAVPVTDPGEVAALADSGAAELYCGVLEPWWERRYGGHDSVSRRQGLANLRSREDLAHVAEQARRRGLPVYLTVNGRYIAGQIDYLVGLCLDFEASGGTGLQVFDWGLMQALREAGTSLRLCLSLLGVAANTHVLAFYVDCFAISRVVFPRFLTPLQAGQLLAPFPGLEGEVMVAGDRCPLVDGYCRFYHGNACAEAAASGEATCGTAARAGRAARDEASCGEASYGEAASGTAAQAGRVIRTYDTTYRTHSCRTLLGSPPNEYPCAACAMGDLEDAGVAYAKIGGRGTPLAYRLSLLGFLRDATGLATNEEKRRLYHEAFGSPCNCYTYLRCDAGGASSVLHAGQGRGEAQ